MAAVPFGGWLGYSRMYRLAAAHAVVLSGVGWLAVSGGPLELVGLLLVVLALALGFYGNTLYFKHFGYIHRTLSKRHQDQAGLVDAIARAGGVDARAGWLTVLAPAAATAIFAALG